MTLKSIQDHNRQRREEREAREEAAARTGVACPNCHGELRWVMGWGVVTLQYPTPTTAPACCEKCRVTVQLER